MKLIAVFTSVLDHDFTIAITVSLSVWYVDADGCMYSTPDYKLIVYVTIGFRGRTRRPLPQRPRTYDFLLKA